MKFSRRMGLAVTLLVLVIFAAYFLVNREKFRPLLEINFWLLILIAAGDMAGVIINGLFTKFILRPFNKHIPLLESFYVSLISSVGNFFAPAGAGFGFRAIYLKRRFDLAYSDYISTLSGNYIIVFLVNSFFGLLSLYLLRSRSDSQYGILVAVFAIIFLVSTALSIINIPIKPNASKHNKLFENFLKNIWRVTNGWNHIVKHRLLIIQLILLTVLNFLLTAGITYTIIKSLHFNIELAPLVLFSVLGSLSLFINITPANLGIKEAIYLFSSSVLGFSAAQILSIALIDRGVMFLVLAGLWAVSHKIKSPIPS